MYLSEKDFVTLRPGDEMLISVASNKIKDTVAFYNKTDNSLVTANGLIVVPGLTIEKTGKNFSEFATLPSLYKLLKERKMVVKDVKELMVGDCVLVFNESYSCARAATVAISDMTRKIAFGKDGQPISVQTTRVTFAGLRDDPEKLSSIGMSLLSDAVNAE